MPQSVTSKDGVRFEYFDTRRSLPVARELTGWYWLDELRGVWYGPFKTILAAESDYDKAHLLTRKT